jgi:riboflavin synthase
MFTGIIEETGSVRELQRRGEGGALSIGAKGVLEGMRLGDSIAVNGACLTASRIEVDRFVCDLSAETLERTCLGNLRPGSPVNLERPLSVGDRLGGHFVTGHVDGVGRLVSMEPSGEGSVMTVQFPRDRYLVYKGSIAVDGISLTIASLADDRFTVALIPLTLSRTNLSAARPGDRVNLEADILGKYFERFFRLGLLSEKPAGLTFDYLKEQGF